MGKGLAMLWIFGRLAGVQAQPPAPPIVFEQLSLAQGLSQSNINCITQDQKGFIWMGTGDGLNLYDGYSFRSFHHDPNIATSLSANHIWSIFPAAKGGLWVGTVGGGLNYLDTDRETCERFVPIEGDTTSLSGWNVLSIWEDSRGWLWLGTTKNGLNVYNPRTGIFRRFPEVSGPGKRPIYSICEDAQKQIWLGTYGGLVRVRIDESEEIPDLTFKRYTSIDSGLSSNAVRSITVAPEGGIWVGTWNGGLHHFDPQLESFQQIRHDPENPNSLSSDFVASVQVDRTGTLWVGTFDKGVNRFDADQHTFLRFEHEAGNPNHLSSNFVSAIFEDRSGLLWVGTYGGGANLYSPYREKFRHYRQEANNVASLSNDLVFAFEESQTLAPGQFWIATHGGGLNLFDPDKGTFEHFRHDLARSGSISNDVVISVLEDRTGNLWVGTRNGLNRCSRGQFEAYRKDPSRGLDFDRFAYEREDSSSLFGSFVWSLLEDAKGQIWVGTRRGLNRYLPETNAFDRYFQGPAENNSLVGVAMISLHQATDGTIWAGTYSGLNECLLDEKGAIKTIIPHKYRAEEEAGISHNTVYAIESDAKGCVWFGTGGGLNVRMPDGKMQHYRQAAGLPNDVIKSLVADQEGRMWLATNRGISSFDPDEVLEGKVDTVFRNYDAKEGLQSNEFHERAAYLGTTGMILMGGVSGFTTFFPALLADNPAVPPVYLTGLQILNEPVKVGAAGPDGRVILPKTLNTIEVLDLSHRDYVLTFEFAALNYTLSEKNRYRYRLEGFDETWTEAGTRRSVTYTNLDAGAYRFRVQGTNNDGRWSPHEALLALRVAPPPWKTWWAYTMYVLVLAGLIMAFVRFKIREREKELLQAAALERTKMEERERVRKKSSEDFHDELGNKLTKITLFTELARRNAPESENMNSFLGRIQENVQQLSEGMRDFIWVLDPEKDSLYDTMLRLKDFGDQLFEHTDILFQPQGIQENLTERNLSLDTRRHLVLLFKEAMNNALKYADCKQVWLVVEAKPELISISLKDDGKGFDREEKTKGYGLSNMESRAQKMNASFEINSAPGLGTQISISWKLPQMGD